MIERDGVVEGSRGSQDDWLRHTKGGEDGIRHVRLGVSDFLDRTFRRASQSGAVLTERLAQRIADKSLPAAARAGVD